MNRAREDPEEIDLRLLKSGTLHPSTRCKPQFAYGGRLREASKLTMTTHDPEGTTETALADKLTISAKANQNIHVSPAVLDAARKDGEELLRSLRTTAAGLTQTEAEERARTAGPNEVAQERQQGWPRRLLKIIRNPLVILLATLSTISFATGDARAGTVMAAMVVLSVALRFLPGSARGCGGGEAQGHDPCYRHGRSGWHGKGDPAS